jgi:hypothetical protein
MRKRYQQAAMRLARAQKHLQTTRPGSEALGIEKALLECEMAFCDLRRHGLTPEGPALSQAAQLARLLDRSQIQDPARRNVYLAKAEQLTPVQMHAVREAVDVVARWADEGLRGRKS